MTIDTGGKPFGGSIMKLEKDEKLYKIYRFFPKKNPGYHFEYRILTKINKNGKLEMASYNYKVVDGKVSKGNVTRVTDMVPEEMDSIVQGMKRNLEQVSPSHLEIIDLTKYESIEDQIDALKELDKVSTQYME